MFRRITTKLEEKSILEWAINSSKTQTLVTNNRYVSKPKIISTGSGCNYQDLCIGKKMSPNSLFSHQLQQRQYFEMPKNFRFYSTHSKKPDSDDRKPSYKPFYWCLSGPVLDFLHQHFYNGDGGLLFARGLRSMVFTYGMTWDKRKHDYKFRIKIGKITDYINADEFSSYLNERIYRTVPLALMGGDGKFRGKRLDGAVATAGGVGDVTTWNKGCKMINQTRKRHLLDDGMVTITLEEENGILYLDLVGTGAGNFAGFNEKLGKPTFYTLMLTNKICFTLKQWTEEWLVKI